MKELCVDWHNAGENARELAVVKERIESDRFAKKTEMRYHNFGRSTRNLCSQCPLDVRTTPEPENNGNFDSKFLSRQYAEVLEDNENVYVRNLSSLLISCFPCYCHPRHD